MLFAEVTGSEVNTVGTVALGLLILLDLSDKWSRFNDRRKARIKQENGEGWVTRHEFNSIVERIFDKMDKIKDEFNKLTNDRRADMDRLDTKISALARSGAQSGTKSDTEFIANLNRLRNIRVLYVEDNEHDRMLLKRAVGGRFQVDEASDLEEAFAMIDRHDYDCVLLDLNLGIVRGEETLRTFRQRCPRACAIVVSGDDSPALIGKAMSYGFETTVYKGIPGFDVGELSSKITAALIRNRK